MIEKNIHTARAKLLQRMKMMYRKLHTSTDEGTTRRYTRTLGEAEHIYLGILRGPDDIWLAAKRAIDSDLTWTLTQGDCLHYCINVLKLAWTTRLGDLSADHLSNLMEALVYANLVYGHSFEDIRDMAALDMADRTPGGQKTNLIEDFPDDPWVRHIQRGDPAKRHTLVGKVVAEVRASTKLDEGVRIMFADGITFECCWNSHEGFCTHPIPRP